MRKRTSQPRSRSSGRSCSRCASEPEMPATFWVCRRRRLSCEPRRVEDAARPATARSGLPRRARAADVRAPRYRPWLISASALIRSASRPGPRERSAGRPSSSSSKMGFEASTGQARRGCLVDDLVGCARAHVVDERVVRRRAAPGYGCAEQASPIARARRGRARPRAARARRGAPAPRRRATGPWTCELDVGHRRRHCRERLVEPLRRRVAAEREQSNARPRSR